MKQFFYFCLFFVSLSVFSSIPKFQIEDELKMLKMAEMNPDYFLIDESSIEFKVVEDDTILEELNVNPFLEPDFNDYYLKSTLNDTIAQIEDIINIGKKLWAIVKAGEPVVNLRTDWASAVPKGIRTWEELHSWRTPKAVNYTYLAHNKLGMNVVNIVYRVIFTYGGKYKDIGSFLTNVKVVPIKVNVIWGYEVDMFVEVPDVLNVGSNTDPIGALMLEVRTQVSTVLKKAISGQTFFITGSGEFRDFEN